MQKQLDDLIDDNPLEEDEDSDDDVGRKRKGDDDDDEDDDRLDEDDFDLLEENTGVKVSKKVQSTK